MILSEIWQEIRTRANDSSVTTEQMNTWINMAIKQATTRTDFPWATTEYSTDVTVASQVEYTLQTDFKKMISIRVGEASTTTELESTEYSYVDYKSKNVSTTGNFYYLNPATAKFGLIPTPTTAGLPIYLKYFAIPDSITTDSEKPPFPESYHELVIFFALKKYFEVNDDGQKALYYNAEFENMIELMKNDLLVRSTGQLSRMKDVRELVGTEQPQKFNGI